jgi:nitrite reductase (NADH) small subunit
MKEYVIGPVSELPEDRGLAVQAGRHVVAVFRTGDEVFAVHNTCPHKGGPLCDGVFVPEKRMVRCPWHYWNWHLDSGELEADPRQGLRRFEVRIENGEAIVCI